jgi:hypothetical protein
LSSHWVGSDAARYGSGFQAGYADGSLDTYVSRHARQASRETIGFALDRCPALLRRLDQVPKALGEDGTPDPGEAGGRGLFLVAVLSTRWNWYPTHEPAGTVVWCELARSP